MSTLGIVIAKELSNRFPNKNIHPYKGYPLFWHSVKPMLESDLVDEVIVSTNSNKIKDFCTSKNVRVIWRPNNASYSEEPLLNVLNFTYKNLDTKFNKVLCILANAPGHTKTDIEKSIEIMDNNNLNEVRSFDKKGVENGLLLFKEGVLLRNSGSISTYMGCIINNVKEVHYKNDLI